MIGIPVELNEYSRRSNIKLSIEGEVLSMFAKHNLEKNIYKNDTLKIKSPLELQHFMDRSVLKVSICDLFFLLLCYHLKIHFHKFSYIQVFNF